jgi:energy-coupling factor transport system substrate-specific component
MDEDAKTKGHEIFTCWKDTKIVVRISLLAAIFAVTRVLTMGFVLIPGHTEFRVVSVFNVIFGLLFGPAGAWGCAIGNLIGDFFGTLSLGSIGGFVGNFFFTYVPYLVWKSLLKKEEYEPKIDSFKKVVVYVIAVILGATVEATIINFWVSGVLGLTPFKILGPGVFLNNPVSPLILGIPLLLLFYPRLKKWQMVWTDEEESNQDISLKRKITGMLLLSFSGIGCVVLWGLIIVGSLGQINLVMWMLPLVLAAFISLMIL